MNPYEVLGVAKDAPFAEIKAAYRRLAKRLHPDIGGDPDAFADVAAAYAVLSDETRRKQYDETGDAEVLRVEGQARMLITDILLQAIEVESNPLAVDLLGRMREVIQRAMGKRNEAVETAEAKIARRQRLVGRFRRKTEGDNFLEDALVWSIKRLQEPIRRAEDEQKVARRAIEILEEFELDGEGDIEDLTTRFIPFEMRNSA